MKRKPGMSVAAFRDYYENHHVPLAMANSGGQGGGQRQPEAAGAMASAFAKLQGIKR